jgi:hypothetical protein
VVVTANHYWLDGVVALVLLAASLLVVRRMLPPKGTEPTRDELVEPAGRELAAGPELIGVRT